MKKMRHSKTMWFSLALVIFGAILDNLPALQAQIDPKYYSFGLISIGVVVAILRYLTSEPIQ